MQASGSNIMLNEPNSSKDRSSGMKAMPGGVKSGAHNRGQSTDDSSMPMALSKSNSAIPSAHSAYKKIPLTKDVLHEFEE